MLGLKRATRLRGPPGLALLLCTPTTQSARWTRCFTSPTRWGGDIVFEPPNLSLQIRLHPELLLQIRGVRGTTHATVVIVVHLCNFQKIFWICITLKQIIRKSAHQTSMSNYIASVYNESCCNITKTIFSGSTQLRSPHQSEVLGLKDKKCHTPLSYVASVRYPGGLCIDVEMSFR